MNHGWVRRGFQLSLLGLLAFACGAATPRRGAQPGTPFDAPLGRPPLAPPLIVTGGFGEYRVGHFHAGFDFGTGGKVGRPVFAPLAGHVERIRASGVGYGRSIYLRTRDGRLIQFGHLDAYAEPMASYVRAIQDSAGQYEQDLWPAASRFQIKLGQRIAWTGESGAGGPHMHFEIRRGDMAYQPQLAGLKVRDDRAPSIASLTLEPLDDTSYVEGSAAPVTRRFGARAETLCVIGRVRAVVGARDGTWSGVDRMVPWLTRMEWGANWIECRMDSISWATDMSEGDYVYDAGRVIGEKGLVLWASRGFRPRFIRSSAPLAEEAGTIRVARGDAPLSLKVIARDVSGHVERRTVVIRGGAGPDTTRTLAVKNARSGDNRFEFAALPYGYLRVTYRGSRAGTRGVWIDCDRTAVRPATPGPDGWTAILRPPTGTLLFPRAWSGTAPKDDGPMLHAVQDAPEPSRDRPVEWDLATSARFDSSVYVARGPSHTRGLPSTSAELVAVEGVPNVSLGPESEPLRGRLKLRMLASDKPHTGVFRYDDDGWTWVGDQRKGDRYEVDSGRLGWFAEFVDTLGPRITLRTPPRTATAGPYNRWAVEASLEEHGSGVNARESYFAVDGKRVAVEWDPEADVLRWRPLEPPPSGTHRYDVVAADRAGNISVRSGTFMLD